MREIERRIAREAKAMTRQEIMKKALAQRITWRQAADLLGVCDRQVRRLRLKAERQGVKALTDGRGKPRRKRIPDATIRELCRLRRELYEDFSIRHFFEFATEKHRLKLSYTKALQVLQAAGLAEKAAARGKYRRKRERRPMAGMMLHLDASTHGWIEGLPNHDLVVMLDDATSEILYARFFEQEGVISTLDALKYVLSRHGRFCELYTDRGSHFCNTKVAKDGPDQIQQGSVPRALKAMGIRQIWAYSPQARGRSERAFGTLQGRLPQELKLAGIETYAAANRYLERVFISAYNRRFAVSPAQPERAFAPLPGLDLDLVLSIQHERTVRNDNTVLFGKTFLQLPPSPERLHHARCQVTVHELVDGDLAVSYQGKALGRFSRAGRLRVEERNGKQKKVAYAKPYTAAVAGPLWQGSGHP